MAVTITPTPGGRRVAKFTVEFSVDADTTATIAHGMDGVPDSVGILFRDVECHIGQVHVSSITATQVVVTKTAAVGSGGTTVDVSIFVPKSLL